MDTKQNMPLVSDEEQAHRVAITSIIFITELNGWFNKLGYQDKQWYLDWKDSLNVLSIDPDRPDIS